MTDLQLDVFGGVTAAPVSGGRRIGFSAAQRQILGVVIAEGVITSTQAGVISHAHRHEHGRLVGCKGSTASSRASKWTPGARSGACCCWAATDGGAVMKRLAKRGIVERVERGWMLCAR